MIYLLSIFKWILYSTIISSILACTILIIKFIFKEKLGVRLNYCVWFLLLIRLIIPYAPQSSISIFNIFHIAESKLLKNKTSETQLRKIDLSNDKLINNKVDSKNIKQPNDYVYDIPKNEVVETNNLDKYNKEILKNHNTNYMHYKVPDMKFYNNQVYFDLTALLWIIGVVILGVYIISVNIKFRLKLSNELKCKDKEILKLLDECKLKVGLNCNIEILNTDLVKSPAVFGIKNPKLLLPTNIKQQIDYKELRYVILHEISHVKRKDIPINCVVSILQTLHWFNPILWYSFYIMRGDKELACDAFALSHINSSEYINYGYTILKLIENHKKTKYFYGYNCIVNNKSEVKRRISMISLFNKNSYKWPIISIIVLIILSLVTLTNPKNSPVLATKGTDKKIATKEYGSILDRNGENLTDKNIINGVKLQYDKYLSQSKSTAVNDVVLTLDNNIQNFCEKAAEKAVKDNKAKAVNILVMNPNNGEILSMVDKRTPSLNNDSKTEKFENSIINYSYAPGSIFKVIIATAALNEKVIDPNSYEVVCNGQLEIGHRIVTCWKRDGHGKQNFHDVLSNSCNIGFADLGKTLGTKNLNKYIETFGFGKKTGIDLPSEQPGFIKNTKDLTNLDLAIISLGQMNTSTPIQYLTAFNSIANGGTWIRPHVMKEIVKEEDGKKDIYKKFDDYGKKQILNKATTDMIKRNLEEVISKNGVTKTHINGYNIGSKTGTSQKLINGKYENGKYISNFVGMASLKDSNETQFTILISIDEPDPKNYYATQITTPIAKEIINEISNYYESNPKH
ncbi:M56 family metallopeptidase [Clostridium lundense]|uniref:M56 family metallopeptidase n=1 Tax=Clostridium lundense TaxID=319475 RepID=UPI000A02A3BE|nr:M56 family metallopeptidase [Clostridium lundense]